MQALTKSERCARQRCQPRSVKAGLNIDRDLAEPRDVTYVDLRTSHWPMWSRPQELAAIIGDLGKRA